MKEVAEGQVRRRSQHLHRHPERGFCQLFTINSASVGNFVRAAELLVEWVTECIRYARENEYVRISPMVKAEDEWVNHVNEAGANIPGKARALLTSPATAPVMRSIGRP